MQNLATSQRNATEARERSVCDLEDRVWQRTVLEAEAATQAVTSWRHVIPAVRPEFQEVLTAKARGLQPTQAAAVLGISPLEAWDRTLEAEAAARQVAGLPDLDPALEQNMRGAGLWPAEARPLPVNMGAVVLRSPDPHRAAIYARISGVKATDAPLWGMAPGTYRQRLATAGTRLALIAEAFGAIPSAHGDDPWPADVVASVLGVPRHSLFQAPLMEAYWDAGVRWWSPRPYVGGFRRGDISTMWAAIEPCRIAR